MSISSVSLQPAPYWPSARPPEAEEETRPTDSFETQPPEAAELPPKVSEADKETAPPGQSDNSGPPASGLSGGVVDEFLKWAQMSPAEQVRARYLEEEGLTEESLDALPPEERARIETEIENRMKSEFRTAAESPAEQNIRISINASYARSMQRLDQQEQAMWGG